MRGISAHNAKQNFGAVLESAQNGPVEILKYRQRVAVVLSADEFDELETLKFIELRRKVNTLLEHIENADQDSACRMIRELPRLLRRIEARHSAHVNQERSKNHCANAAGN